MVPVKFNDPDNTSLLEDTSTGIDSPVKAFVSKEDSPLIIIPSSGIFSPGLTSIMSPTLTLSGSTISYVPSLFFKFAKSGRISIKLDIDFLDFLTA